MSWSISVEPVKIALEFKPAHYLPLVVSGSLEHNLWGSYTSQRVSDAFVNHFCAR